MNPQADPPGLAVVPSGYLPRPQRTVDGNDTTLNPRTQQPFNPLDHRNDDEDETDRLRILANTDPEPGHQTDELVKPEDQDCGANGGRATQLVIKAEAKLTWDRAEN